MPGWLDDFVQDSRIGLRSLARTPAITAIALLSLAFGIMACTAMYSVVHAVILDPFPYRDVDSLMSVKVQEPGARGFRLYYTPDQYLEIARRSTIFDGVIASTISDVLWTGSGEPQRLRGNYVTVNTFDVMGVPPLAGRAIEPSDGQPGAEPVAVLGYRCWQTRFAADRGVLGRKLNLNGKIRTVVGIMPMRFMWRGADVYLPVVYERGRAVEGVLYVHVLGRLKPGVTAARAEADLRPIIADLQHAEPPAFPKTWRVGLLSFKETFPSAIRSGLWILFGAVGLLLAIACANVSNLLLVKAIGRRREMAIRASLGALEGRLLRQLLTESVVLGLAGGAIGVVLAFGALEGVMAMIPANTIPDEAHVEINLPVLWFMFGVAVGTSILFGLAPALQAASGDLATPLAEASRGSAGSVRATWFGNGLVVAQVALSLVLLAGAGLVIRVLGAMRAVDLGFRPEQVLLVRAPLSPQRYPDAERRIGFWRSATERLRSVPGVAAVGLGTSVHPFGNWRMPMEIAGQEKHEQVAVILWEVNAEYSRALGIPLRAGRDFSESEIASKQHVAIVNEAFARRLLAGASPLGRVVRAERLRSRPFQLPDDSFRIIGVVRDTQNGSFLEPPRPEMYVPYTLTGQAESLAVLASGAPAAIVSGVRAAIHDVDPDQPVTDVYTAEHMLDTWVYAEPRFHLVLLGAFAAVGLGLAIIGVYGVMSNSVARATREIGVRMAMGAAAGDILGLVLRRGGRLLALGVLIGAGVSFFAVRLLASQFSVVGRADPLTLSVSAAILTAAGLAACWWPARRAARTDPVAALRHE